MDGMGRRYLLWKMLLLYLSIVLGIKLVDNLFKITLRFLVFY